MNPRVRLIVIAAVLTTAAWTTHAQVYTPGDVETIPQPLYQKQPEYTEEAREGKIEGTVLLNCVVLTDGKVGDVNIVRSLDSVHGLDRQAMLALEQWTFTPGTKDGKPVQVLVHIEMTFTLE